jgi:hypothetical protein
MNETAGYNWTDCKIHTETAKELNISQFLTKYRHSEEIICNI